jgi:hypothetical protein
MHKRVTDIIATVYNTVTPPTHPILTAGTVQSWFEKHESELQHILWPAKSPNLNIIEPLWSVLEARVRNRFQPPTFVEQLENDLQEELYKIPLETVQNLYEPIPRRIVGVLKTKGGPTPC